MHGAARAPEDVERGWFEQLPEDDPHWIKERSRQLPLPPPFASTLAQGYAATSGTVVAGEWNRGGSTTAGAATVVIITGGDV